MRMGVEIKVTLTAAKTNLGGEDVPSAFDVDTSISYIPTNAVPSTPKVLEPTQEEKDNVAKLMASLGL